MLVQCLEPMRADWRRSNPTTPASLRSPLATGEHPPPKHASPLSSPCRAVQAVADVMSDGRRSQAVPCPAQQAAFVMLSVTCAETRLLAEWIDKQTLS